MYKTVITSGQYCIHTVVVSFQKLTKVYISDGYFPYFSVVFTVYVFVEFIILGRTSFGLLMLTLVLMYGFSYSGAVLFLGCVNMQVLYVVLAWLGVQVFTRRIVGHVSAVFLRPDNHAHFVHLKQFRHHMHCPLIQRSFNKSLLIPFVQKQVHINRTLFM